MRRKTLLESLGVAFLLAVAAGIGWSRFQARRDAPRAPDPTPTPRMRSLMRVRNSPKVSATPTPSSDPSSAADHPAMDPSTGFLVVQVEEADGSVPADSVTLFNRELGFEREVHDGRAILESLTGSVTLSVRAGDRTAGPQTVVVEADASTDLVFTLPEPEPPLASTGLRLEPAEGFYRIAEVIPDTPAADVGLQAGDAVLQVGNVPVAELTPAEITLSLLGAPGDSVWLLVVIRNQQGDFEEHQVELVLEP